MRFLENCGWGAFGSARNGAARTAVFSEIADEIIRHSKVGCIDQLPAHSLLRNQSSTTKVLQMKRQRGRRYLESQGNAACTNALRAGLNEKAIHAKAMLMP